MKAKPAISVQRIERLILMVRGNKVILDADLAELYGVETRVLKQAVRRNKKRFPADFMFELTKEENQSLRSQNVILERGKHSKYLPFAFTEQDVAMLSSVLNGPPWCVGRWRGGRAPRLRGRRMEVSRFRPTGAASSP